MTKYRITIDVENSEEVIGRWDSLYEQVVHNLDVSNLVTIINKDND